MSADEGPGSAPDAVAPPPHHPRFPLLDGMRAIAVLSVVVVHVSFFAAPGTVPIPRALMHLNIGVTVFFLISGFLLYRPFIAHRARGAPPPAIATYAKRRALRIFPAYWAALTILTVLPGVVGVANGDWLSQYSLTFLIGTSHDAGSCAARLDCGLSQTWSLVVELTFYIALPLWFLISERLSRARAGAGWVARELGLLAVLAAVSVFLHFGSGARDVETLAGGTLLGYWLWFATGMALAIASVALEGRRPPAWASLIARRPELSWIAAAVVYGVVCAVLPPTFFLLEDGQQLTAHVLFALVALLLMLPAVFGDRAGGLPRALLASPAVAWLGLISYGIFLWHYVIALELGSGGSGLGFWPLLGATSGLAVMAAAISYYLLERPILRLKYR
jgi:peptidoglycan/LPS O-acetylase OafA/YrhL